MIPEDHRSTSISEEEGEFLYDFVRKKNLQRTLEVGFAYGASAAYIISATRGPHFAIDPFQDEYEELGLKNLRRAGLEHLLNLKRDYSHSVLPQMLAEGVRLDFAFVDGGHKFDEIFVDFYYIDLLLQEGGYVIFHDAWMCSTQHVISWIKKNRRDYQLVYSPIANLTIAQKVSQDSRPWVHFERFSTMKSLLSHSIFKIRRSLRR